MKIVCRIFLTIALAFLGLSAGTYIGGQYFVPKGSGLAGPAIALGYGFFGALIALTIAIILSVKLAKRSLAYTALASSVLALVLVGFLTVRFMERQETKDKSLRSYSGPPAVTKPQEVK